MKLPLWHKVDIVEVVINEAGEMDYGGGVKVSICQAKNFG